MSFDVTVILPNNLRSGYLQSEFIAGGLAYTSNKFSYDPNLDSNKNQLALSFELKDKTSRNTVAMRRIHALYVSNDPYFEPSSTIKITEWPPSPDVFSSTVDYTYNINSNYFFDNTLSQGSFGATTSGTGIFKINNWALSANGGLSKVYLKAVIEGPSQQLVEYPNGYGIFDTISWEGEIPVNPDKLEFSTLKDGWIGQSTKAIFKPGSSLSQINNNGIASYLISSYTVSATGNTLDIYSSTGSTTIYRSLSPSASTASTTCETYNFYRSGGINYYSSASHSFDSTITRTSYNATSNNGLMFYTRSKVLNSTSKPDFQCQANFEYTVSSIGITNNVYLKLYERPDYAGSSKEIVVRLEIPNTGNPTSYLYSITNNTESASVQSTSLPRSLVPLLQDGGTMEMYYSGFDTSYAYVESYFTPNTDQGSDSRKSYLLANAMISSLGTTSVGAAFGFENQANDPSNYTSTVTVREVMLSQGTNILSADIGDCSNVGKSGIYQPVSSITNSWSSDQNVEYVFLKDSPKNYTIATSVSTNYVQVNKIDSTDTYKTPGICEVQLYKPSLSKNLSLNVKVLHKSDDFYIAFSPKSSYRPHSENGLQVEWDRPLGSRIIEDYSYSNNPVNASTIVVLFSKDKNQISILQRSENGEFFKTALKTYSPSVTFDRYIIEISDETPSAISGSKKSKNTNGTYIYVKTSTGSNVDLIGYAQLNSKLKLSEDGLGYYAAAGFIKSDFDITSGVYNKIYEMVLQSAPEKIYKLFETNSLRSFNLGLEALSNEKHYLGQNLLAGNTDLKNFGLINPAYTSSNIVNVSAVSTGTNINLSTIASATIDGVSLASLSLNSYILLKDQFVSSENGIYQKTNSSTYTNVTSSFATYSKYYATAGSLNKYSFFYLDSVATNNELNTQYVSTSVFCPVNIGQISPFVSSIRPTLFEFMLKHLDPNSAINQNLIKVRFFQDSNDSPDGANPLTNWIEINTNPINDNFIVAPNNDLIQVILQNSANNSPLVSQGNKIWVLITAPENSAFGVAEGKTNVDPYILDGSFKFYKSNVNLWHKLYSRYTTKSYNTNHLYQQHLRLRAKSHGKLESYATKLTAPAKVDIIGPKDITGHPRIDNLTNTSLRNVELTITATDSDSGIMAFRIGREIDDFRSQYTPWMPWDSFVVNDLGEYTIYLYGNLNYYTSGTANTGFDIQNIGYSGSRKLWVQLMDYASNVSQSYPVTFVAQSWCLLDTTPPVAKVNFYNSKNNNTTTLTNIIKPIVKIEANDIVSGVKDFKYRRIYDTGVDTWSEWEYYSSYKNLDFTNESDGVKKIEFVFRDYGNNAIQPEEKWEIILRPNK